jgi:hypothetical protein
MNELNDELSSREAAMFRQLAKEKTPPEFLENQIVGTLKRLQLIRSSSFCWQRRLIVFGSATALATAFFFLGATLNNWWKSIYLPTNGSTEFLLLLRNSPREQATRSEDEEFQRIQEYSAWAKKLRREGVLVEGEKLKDEAPFLDVINGHPTITQMDAANRASAVAGYFLIRASDYEDAIRIAQNCPHAAYGGTIEVRQIDSLNQTKH